MSKPAATLAAHRLTSEPVITTVVREVKNMWPFFFGFAVTGTAVFMIARGVTDEDIKNSKFSNPNQKHH